MSNVSLGLCLLSPLCIVPLFYIHYLRNFLFQGKGDKTEHVDIDIEAATGENPAITYSQSPSLMRRHTPQPLCCTTQPIIHSKPPNPTKFQNAPPQREQLPPKGGLRNSDAIIRAARLLPLPEDTKSADVMCASLQFELPSLQIKELKLSNLVGAGSFGQVWLGTWNNTPVAVKVLSETSSLTEQQINSFLDEAKMLSRLRHPNVCMFMGASLRPPHFAIITELVTRGSLWDNLRRGLFPVAAPDQPFWPAWAIQKVLTGTARGLLYLHSACTHKPPIIHRDLKSANLLLDDNLNVKICDFGLAKLRQDGVPLTSKVGTFSWMAPEVIRGAYYTETADIYSFGIVAWELLTGQIPFLNIPLTDLIISVVQKELRPPLLAHFTHEQRDFLKSLWNATPSRRVSLSSVLDVLDKTFPTTTPAAQRNNLNVD